MDDSHESIKELIAPYVLGAVPPDEVPAIRSHLLSCEECMAEADSYAAVETQLALAVPAETLPAGFADRVMQRVQDERPSLAGERAPRRRWRALEAFAALALGLSVLVLGFLYVDARSELSESREIIEALGTDEGLLLKGDTDALAKMVPQDGGGLFVVAGLEPAPSQRDYQLWLMKGECTVPADDACTIESAGTFEIEEGVASLEVDSLRGVDRVAVSVEKEGGSEKPTTVPFIISA